jgi:hypothetical protein
MKERTMKYVFVLLSAALLLFGCGKEEPKASFETQEQARQTVLENAEFNARRFRDASAPKAKILMRGDSSIKPDCITGDGWVSVDLVAEETGAVVSKLKCSSVSASIGCMTQDDFQSRPSYSDQDGVCNRDLPFPLPKIIK